MHRLHLYAIKVTDRGANVIENLGKNPDPVRRRGKSVFVRSSGSKRGYLFFSEMLQVNGKLKLSGSKVEQQSQGGVQGTTEDLKEAGEPRMNKKKENLKLTGIEPATDGYQPKVVGIRRSTN